MCGIVGYVGERDCTDVLLDSLSKLEYRGYDSAGIAVFENGEITVEKAKGELKNLREKVAEHKPMGHCGIGHTRWATHGEPSDINSHPHGNKRVSIVHNGIIENYKDIKNFLIDKGYTFISETDTETVAKLLDYYYEGDPVDAIIKTLKDVRGAYALGIVFKDFDFVSTFEYFVSKEKPLAILNLFDIKEKGGKDNKHYPVINNIFDFEQQVMKPFIQNKYLRVDYFGDLNKDDYVKIDMTFSSFSRYRKAIYDYVYKSQRNTIDGHIFGEMVFNAINDDIKGNNDYSIREKLNIWYSLHEYFNPKNKINMVNKLKDYQDFVATIIADETLTDITDEKFAFAAGQVINYIQSKSKSADNSYNLLEPYLQQSKCTEFKRAIANDFGRYKHENFSKNFEKVAAFVLSYETSANLKHLLPQILSGVFSKNQLFSTNSSK